MTASRPSWRIALGASFVLALGASIPVAAEEEEGPVGHDPSNIIRLLDAQPSDLLGPAAQVLSGRAWLMA